MNRPEPRWRQSTWTVPAVLGIASLAGLVIGLVGDGALDALGWAGLLAPVLAMAWAWFRRAPARDPRRTAARGSG